MTKKHFIALADVARKLEAGFEKIGENVPQRDIQGYRVEACQMVPVAVVRAAVRTALADFCESQNAEFKRDRWLDYIGGNCGPNGGKAEIR